MMFFKFSSLALAFATIVSASPLIEQRAGKPTGGPASASVTIYSGPYTCTDASTPPPTDGSAGTSKTWTVAENTCVILSPGLLTNGAFTATLTATPKTGTAGCYIQLFKESGCGVTLTNQFHGWPFNGIAVGNTVGCANSVGGFGYGALEIVCA